jgi:hypothetical protein
MFKAILPPWLMRTEGLKLIGSFADVIDDHRDRFVAGVKLRFPGLYTLDGIDKTGRERKIRRGPAEGAEVYADRLQRWWEDHRERGNAPTLLEQMLAYFVGTLDAPYDVVSYLGVRHVIDANGTITRDTITWGNDQTGNWARVWVFLVTNAASVSAETLESYAAIVRDWKAAHVVANVVVLHPQTRLWDYPQPAPTWDEGWDWDGGPTIEEV